MQCRRSHRSTQEGIPQEKQETIQGMVPCSNAQCSNGRAPNGENTTRLPTAPEDYEVSRHKQVTRPFPRA